MESTEKEVLEDLSNDISSNIIAWSPSSSTSEGVVGEDSSETLFYPFNGTEEDIFIQAGLNLTTVPELARAVEKCKNMVLETKEYTAERKWLVRHLVELRLRLEEAREAEVDQRRLAPIGTPDSSPSKHQTETGGSDFQCLREKRIVLGHHFVLQSPMSTTVRCDRCCSNIWSFLHVWYQCSDCSFKCHVRCLTKIQRLCAYVRVCEIPFYSNEICPDIGLAAQEYCCYECKAHISFKNTWNEPRQCDYCGRYFCTNCHWNNRAVIPARVVHNWDFNERKVCQSCSQYLQLMLRKPVINLDNLNPQLYFFVDGLEKIKKLRSQILLMKQYLASCPAVATVKRKKLLMWSLSPHFRQFPITLFCLQDLIDAERNSLLPILHDVVHVSIQHIKKECVVCKGKGFLCEICSTQEELDPERIAAITLFPFDEAVSLCPKCSAVFHQVCWMRNSAMCKRCERLQDRLSLLQETVDPL